MTTVLFSSRCSQLRGLAGTRNYGKTSCMSKGVKPFTPIKGTRVLATAASTAEAESVPLESASVLDEAYDELLNMDDEVLENEEMDFDVEEYQHVIDSLANEDALELLAVEELATADPELKEGAQSAKEMTLAKAFAKTDLGLSLTQQENELIGEIASSLGELEESPVDDVVPVKSFSIPDEEELSNISPEEMAAIDQYKLSKAELKALLPKDWESLTIDWFMNKREDQIPLPQYRFNFLWLEKNLAFAVDYVYARGNTSPMTHFYYWPRHDAWDQLKVDLEKMPHVTERDKVILLNRLTEVINYWQEAENPSMETAREQFPECVFTSKN